MLLCDLVSFPFYFFPLHSYGMFRYTVQIIFMSVIPFDSHKIPASNVSFCVINKKTKGLKNEAGCLSPHN